MVKGLKRESGTVATFRVDGCRGGTVEKRFATPTPTTTTSTATTTTATTTTTTATTITTTITIRVESTNPRRGFNPTLPVDSKSDERAALGSAHAGFLSLHPFPHLLHPSPLPHQDFPCPLLRHYPLSCTSISSRVFPYHGLVSLNPLSLHWLLSPPFLCDFPLVLSLSFIPLHSTLFLSWTSLTSTRSRN